MTRTTRALLGISVTAILLITGLLYLRRPAAPAAPAGPPAAARGGQLTATYRRDPSSFNRYVSAHASTELISRLTHDTLVRINRVTAEIEPRLAERWSVSDDSRTWTLTLRSGVRFSDGVPFTSADVLFSFKAAYGAEGTTLDSGLKVEGKPLDISAPDDHTVVIRFPSTFAPGLRILDGLPIYPRHKLEAAFDQGRFHEMWRTSTPPADLTSLGPFTVSQYQAGQRVVLTRNPNFWRTDAAGVRLPYLDSIVIDIVPDQNAEMLRFQAGQADLTTDEIRPDDVATLRREAEAGRVQLFDVGVGLDTNQLWFNLNAAAKANDPRRTWLQSEEFRKAISHAVDRDVFVNTVFLGAGVPIYGPVTPGNHWWYSPDVPTYAYDAARAREWLGRAGLSDRNGDGSLEDSSGRPARFSIITQQGHTIRERSVAVIQEQLRHVGLAVDLVALDPASLFGRWQKGDYDAIFFGVEANDFDPNAVKEYWLSAGGSHFWNPGQARPATEWEAQIDNLMARQETTLDPAARRALYAEAQRVLGEHVPALYFGVPKIFVAASPRLANVKAVLLNPKVLWDAEELALRQPGAR